MRLVVFVIFSELSLDWTTTTFLKPFGGTIAIYFSFLFLALFFVPPDLYLDSTLDWALFYGLQGLLFTTSFYYLNYDSSDFFWVNVYLGLVVFPVFVLFDTQSMYEINKTDDSHYSNYFIPALGLVIGLLISQNFGIKKNDSNHFWQILDIFW